ncbi:MAG: N-acetylmuramoyl-L-alanine amidase [Oscillospiraceae bacterium]|nr:N-acetylmuramoyl-L-alanine amidase [Oscillospiraceae bacterium]
MIREAICTGNRRYRAAEPLRPVGAVLHSIGVPQPRAQVLRDAWQRDASPYVTHYVLDDTEILHCMPDNFKCWHVGSPGNDRFLGIEMCEPREITYTSGAGFTARDPEAAQRYAAACRERAIRLLAKLCRDNGWDPAEAIWTHGELARRKLSNTDHADPEHLWKGLGMDYGLSQLRRDVAAAMGAAEQPRDGLYRIRKAWEDAASQVGAYRSLENALAARPEGYAVFDETGRQLAPAPQRLVRITASALNVRRGPSASTPVVQMLPRGGVYTVVEEVGGWGLLKAYAARRDGWISLNWTETVR